MVYGIWYMVYGIWYMVYGIWYMVYGIWYMVYGIWYMVYVNLNIQLLKNFLACRARAMPCLYEFIHTNNNS